MNQLDMFSEALPRHCQPLHQPIATGPAKQRAKFDGDCKRLLDVLRLRPLFNYELPEFAGLNGRARVSDLRRAGYVIENKAVKSDRPGTTMYTLIGEPQE
jgi:hypothetical protein